MTYPRPVIRLDDRLGIRRPEYPADLSELHRLFDESVEHLRPWMGWVENHSLEATTEYLSQRAARWAAGLDFTYVIVLDGAMVGSCSLHRREDTPEGAYEIGYWLHPAVTGRGLAVRSAQALVTEGFRMPDVERLLVLHLPDNHASAAVPAKLGFTERSRLRDAEGEFRVWELTRPGEQPS
ncbi:GNAT family N-acetyltransferase [Streptomyces roseicoloratus]|uniref:GNAT family N-acetyltransferase n=1 Tax=Streptomyces roseicoloratus TaxID=2508722 RepID=A0ABY9RYQ7_9ACTN|nr:GNAT family N-acetyltransferase [Streptomyces roseicoloratus]WMX47165.1 GNAT family N-acetyltransferase [Streptomyces roseicoloratus]